MGKAVRNSCWRFERTGNCRIRRDGESRARAREFDAIFLACGSGGTAAGVAGNYLYHEKKTDVIAFGVCDTPDVFYDEIDLDMYAHLPGVCVCSRDILRIIKT